MGDSLLPLTEPCHEIIRSLFSSSCPKSPHFAEEDVDELARKVSNPASFMISVPVRSDFDVGRWGDGDTYQATLDIEPVIPFALNDNWNVISHTDFPLVYSDPVGTSGGKFGLGDISQNHPGPPRAADLGIRAGVLEALRAVLVAGATAVIHQAKVAGKHSPGVVYDARRTRGCRLCRSDGNHFHCLRSYLVHRESYPSAPPRPSCTFDQG